MRFARNRRNDITTLNYKFITFLLRSNRKFYIFIKKLNKYFIKNLPINQFKRVSLNYLIIPIKSIIDSYKYHSYKYYTGIKTTSIFSGSLL